MSEFIDQAGLLQPISAEQPCGPDLEGTGEFIEAGKAILGNPDQTIRKLDAEGNEVEEVIPGEPPNWSKVAEQAQRLLGKTKHLSPMMWLSLALLRQQGVSGLRAGLDLIAGAVDAFWDHLYPMMDTPADTADIRAFRFRELSPEEGGAEGELRFLRHLRDTPLAMTRGGPILLNDYLVAARYIKAAETATSGPFTSIEAIQRGLDEVKEEALQRAATDGEACVATLERIREIIEGKAGGDSVPDFKSLAKMLGLYVRPLREALARRSGQAAPAGADAGSAAPGGPAVAGPGGPLNSPQAVTAALGAIIAYYERAEPSSPVPILLKRAQRLVGKNFADAVLDLAREGVKDLEIIAGEKIGAEDGSGDAAPAG